MRSTLISPTTRTGFIARGSGAPVDLETGDDAMDDAVGGRGIRVKTGAEAAEEAEELSHHGAEEDEVGVAEAVTAALDDQGPGSGGPRRGCRRGLPTSVRGAGRGRTRPSSAPRPRSSRAS